MGWVVVLKGHPCSGKSTVARELARRAKLPLLDKDDIKAELVGRTEEDANEISLRVLWSVVKQQARLGVTCVVDATLSSERQFEQAKEAAGPAAKLFVVECYASNEQVWKRRLEERASTSSARDGHKPQTWDELQGLIRSYHGSFEYDPLVLGADYYVRLDTTTGSAGVKASLDEILEIIGRRNGEEGAGGNGEVENARPGGLDDLPESVLSLICAGNLCSRDLAGLALSCKRLGETCGRLCDESGWYECKACKKRIYHKKEVLRGLRMGLSGDSGKFAVVKEPPDGLRGVRTKSEGMITLSTMDTKVLQMLDMYLQKEYSIRYIQYNKLARVLNSPIIHQLYCSGCGVYVGFKFDLTSVDAKNVAFAEAVVSHDLNTSAIMEYLMLLRRFTGVHHYVQRFLAPAQEDGRASGGKELLRCQFQSPTSGACGSVIGFTSDVVLTLSHPRTGWLLPQDLDPDGDGEGLFMSRVSNIRTGDQIGLIGVVPYGLQYRSIHCERCGQVCGWKVEARPEEGKELRPSLMNYIGRFGLFTSRVMKQVASGDGYIMYEPGTETLPSVEQDFRETADEHGVGQFLPTV
ncbi:hypothetical protein A3770_11p64180 [Chloropicon primus]|uniref:Uncharacterized protein n=1 Tax=Chloropicon primus TaxID=1764295 RepID=A0A5B8MWR3_9CHLO|nr:hypothetical protein A3770_11p64180 [Chloropicon primus]|eukprot:QDZ23900.1 hypothetical protein A3770_11p64180 [Chloropicon primus]